MYQNTWKFSCIFRFLTFLSLAFLQEFYCCFFVWLFLKVQLHLFGNLLLAFYLLWLLPLVANPIIEGINTFHNWWWYTSQFHGKAAELDFALWSYYFAFVGGLAIVHVLLQVVVSFIGMFGGAVIFLSRSIYIWRASFSYLTYKSGRKVENRKMWSSGKEKKEIL